jgi:hypothetical protein
MFKQTILSVSLIGLANGSIHVSSDTPNTKEKNVQILAQSFANDAHWHDFLSDIGALAAFAGGTLWPIFNTGSSFCTPWNWDSYDEVSWQNNETIRIPRYTEAQKLTFYTDAKQSMQSSIMIGAGIVVCGALFALYHKSAYNEAKARAKALKNIGNTLTQDSTIA